MAEVEPFVEKSLAFAILFVIFNKIKVMKDILKFIGSLILIYYVYLLFEWIWNSGLIGKIFVILVLVLGVWNAARDTSDESPFLKNHKVKYPSYIHLVE